jgi:YVTN family beta-propeller protein
MKFSYTSLAALAVVALLSGFAEACPISSYTVTDTLNLPGAVRWDLLAFDGQQHRLFITRGESVDVLDTASKEIVGSIPSHGVHGVALAPELNKGFISDGAANTVTVFDLATLKPIATIPAGTKPDVIIYDAKTKRVFAANGSSNDITVINAADNSVAGTIKLGGKPEFAVLDEAGKLYVNFEDKSQMAVIDTKKLKTLRAYKLLPACDGPTGLAIDTNKHRLFAACGNKAMVVVNAKTGKITDTLPIGEHSDGAAFDPATGLTFSSNGDGTLTVVGAGPDGHYQVLQTVTTVPTARTMALDPATHQLYLAAAETDGFDPATPEHPHPRPHMKPDSFMIVTVAPHE